MYTCTFQTPDWDKLDLNYVETKKMLKAYVDLKAYRKKQQEDDAAAALARSRSYRNKMQQDTKKIARTTSTTEDKGEATSSDSFERDDAPSSDGDDQTNVPQDDCEIRPKTEGGTSYLPSNNPPKAKTIEEMALEVEGLTRQVSILTRRYAAPTVAIKSEFPTSVHVKTEGNASEAPIDLVTSSSEDSPDDGSGTDTSRPPAIVRKICYNSLQGPKAVTHGRL